MFNNHYVTLFYRLFHTGIPLSVFVCVIGIAIFVSCLLGFKRTGTERYKSILIIWIIACLFLMLYSTIIGRESQHNVSIHLIPFWSIGAINDGYIETLYEKINNVLFFIPYGLLLGLRYSFGASGSNGSRTIVRSLMIGAATSMGIELLQLITGTGTCETDDVICNTLGCLIGAYLAVGSVKLYERIRK